MFFVVNVLIKGEIEKPNSPYSVRTHVDIQREASQARVSQFYLKTGGGATAGGARDIIT
jgi:hypothetical protein